MILSVVVYNHKLTLGQWGGAAVVFAGIGVEAWVKRKGAYHNSYLQRLCMLIMRFCQTSTRRRLRRKRKRRESSLYRWFEMVYPIHRVIIIAYLLSFLMWRV